MLYPLVSDRPPFRIRRARRPGERWGACAARVVGGTRNARS